MRVAAKMPCVVRESCSTTTGCSPLEQLVVMVPTSDRAHSGGVDMKSLDQNKSAGSQGLPNLRQYGLREEVGEHDQVPFLLAPVEVLIGTDDGLQVQSAFLRCPPGLFDADHGDIETGDRPPLR